MPHTSRRKKALTSNKLVKVTTEDGWSVMSRKSTVQLHKTPSKGDEDKPTVASETNSETNYERIHERLTLPQLGQLRGLSASTGPASSFSPQPAQCSVNDLRQRFNEVQKLWVATEMGRRVENILNTQMDGTMLETMTKGVCLGLGSLSIDKFAWHRVSMWQTVAFLELANAISKRRSNTRLELYAQEPAFNNVDRSFLAGLGVEVLDSPNAFEVIDHKTFVFAPHYSVAWWPAVMRLGDVPLIIGNDVEKALPRIPHQEELVQIFRRTDNGTQDAEIADPNVHVELIEFLKKRASLAYPSTDEDQHAFIDLRFYWEERPRDNLDQLV